VAGEVPVKHFVSKFEYSASRGNSGRGCENPKNRRKEGGVSLPDARLFQKNGPSDRKPTNLLDRFLKHSASDRR
jgi:hypothetical protein